MTLVHLRAMNSENQKPLAFRLRMVHENGNQACPLGRQINFQTIRTSGVGGQALVNGKVYHWIDGSCEIPLEAGRYYLELEAGIRFVPLRRTIEVKPGQAALRFNLEPCNFRWKDWIQADARCHSMSPAAALLEGSAGGLNIVHLLAREFHPDVNQPADISDLLEFSGQKSALNNGTCEVYVNTLNSNPVLGSVSILNSHRIVFPLASCTKEHPDLWSVSDWCAQGHRKNGLVGWVLGGQGIPRLQGEALSAAILREMDYLEISNSSLEPDGQLAFWYELLNAGVQLPALGASGKENNSKCMDSMTTWCKPSGNGPTHTQWLESARTGDCFIGAGALLEITKPENKDITFEGGFFSSVENAFAEWVVNGKVIVSHPITKGEGQINFTPPNSFQGWMAFRIVDENRLAFLAHSNPVYFDKADPSLKATAVELLIDRLRETADFITRSDYGPLKFKEEILANIKKASEKLTAGN